MTKTLTVWDFEEKFREMATKHSSRPQQVAYFDGLLADDEPDCDDVPLAVGDRVKINFMKSGILKLQEGQRPFLYATVTSIEPWDESLAGRVFVETDRGAGAWYERDWLLKEPTTTT